MPRPIMESYRRHVLVCTGGFCSPDRQGRGLYSRLAELLEVKGDSICIHWTGMAEEEGFEPP